MHAFAHDHLRSIPGLDHCRITPIRNGHTNTVLPKTRLRKEHVYTSNTRLSLCALMHMTQDSVEGVLGHKVNLDFDFAAEHRDANL